MVRWPDEDAELQRLRAAGTPRLLLVAEGSSPPPLVDLLEDWIRVPADEQDLWTRMQGLGQRLRLTTPARAPALDDHVLRHGSLWVALAPVEARLLAPLVDGYERVVTRHVLLAAGWPGAEPERNVLDVQMLHVRRKAAAVGLAVRTIRSRGYLLEPSAHAADAGTQATSSPAAR